MSAESCPACGIALESDVSRCPACGEPLRSGPKRGERTGVRVDHGRLERAMLDLDRQPRGHGWARPSTPPPAMPTPRVSEQEPEEASRSKPATTGPDETSVASPSGGRSPSMPPLAQPEATRVSSVPPRSSARAAPLPLDAEVVLDMRPDATPPRAPTVPTPTETRLHHGRPPVLASEALLRDLAPAKPAPHALRYTAAGAGIVGAALVMALTGTHGIGVPLTAAFAALALLALPPMPYPARAASIVTVAGSGLLLVLATHPDAQAQRANLLLTVPVTLLATGLYFRAFHRASELARALVVLGVLAGVVFLGMSGALKHLTMTDTAWQSWVPRLLGMPFGMLLMLSLLAFMDARTTAGCAIWASCVLLFHTVYTYLELLRVLWPKDAAAPDLSLLPRDVVLAELCAPLLTAVLALGLAQVLATTMARAIKAPRHAQRPT